MFSHFFFAPLEQFCIISCSACAFLFDKIIITFILIIFIFFSFVVSMTNRNSGNTIMVIPFYTQQIVEGFLQFITSTVSEHIQLKNNYDFVPLIGALFLFVFFTNVFGVFPYTYTLTSQLIITFTVAFTLFLTVHVLAIQSHNLKFFALFFPSGVSVVLSFLLVPIEFISFIFKPISMSVRLFANMMAGHTLLKVIAGFVGRTLTAGGLFSVVAHAITFLLLVILIGLELGVAVVQSGVITILLSIYINDAFNIH